MSQNKKKTQQKKRDPWGVNKTFEHGVEFAKDTASQVAEVFNPFAHMFETSGKNETTPSTNHSPLDQEKLTRAYEQQDQEAIREIQKQLYPEQYEEQQEQQEKIRRHKEYKREEERIVMEERQEEEEKKRQEAIAEQQKRQQEEEERIKNQQQQSTPKGKVRRSIFGGRGKRKATSELPAEVKPGGFKH
ncbi:hypothetical protein KC726_03445 [Candidatus Woesebacteria bacterium]|nr:hypothetical protein [Candidatus Woesebacteria bacterium]